MRLKSLDKRIKYRIARSKDNVFVPGDFFDLSDRDRVGRALRFLIKQGDLVKIGYGVYSKSRYSTIFNKVQPVKPVQELAREALEKMGVKIAPTFYEAQYNKGNSTQVPTGRVIGVKSRVARKISYDGFEVSYERIP